MDSATLARLLVTGGLSLLCFAPGAHAQPAPENSARFAAADVQPSPSVVMPVFDSSFRPNGLYHLHNATMVDLIRIAWDIEPDAIAGGPPWLDTDRFEINAKAPAKSTQAERAAMLRALLAERFKLAVHTGEKETEVYALTVGPRGAHLEESGAAGDATCKGDFKAGPPPLITVACVGMTMAEFGKYIRRFSGGNYIRHPVADLTGLKGAYTIAFTLSPNGAPKANDAGEPIFTSIFDAVDKQLGLKLDLTRRAFPVIVVAHVERTPTPNDPEALKLIPAPETEFEAATIKVNKSGDDDERIEPKPGGRLEVINFLLRDLIEFAWHYEDDDRIVGLPAWAEKERYDIIGKTAVLPDEKRPAFDDMRLMVRALLIERFHIKARDDQRPIGVWALTVSKRGAKLKDAADPSGRSACTRSPSQTGSGSAALPAMSYVCTNTAMAEFAQALQNIAGGYVDKPAVDMTGLQGKYDFTLTWNPRSVISSGGRGETPHQSDSDASDPSGGITFFAALEKEVGLHLEGGQRHTMPVLVIDHVEPLGPDQ
jgi:uncharacterized protein (TIGR03435 family)